MSLDNWFIDVDASVWVGTGVGIGIGVLVAVAVIYAVSRKPFVLKAVAALAVGTLVGLMIGLTKDTLVGTILATLLSLIGVTAVGALAAERLGFWRGKKLSDGDQEKQIQNDHVIALSFASACAVALLGGTWAHEHDILKPTPEHVLNRWAPLSEHVGSSAASSIDSSLYVKLAILEYLDKTPELDWYLSPPVQPPECVRTYRAGTETFRNQGGTWKDVADAVAPLDSVARQTALDAAWALKCVP